MSVPVKETPVTSRAGIPRLAVVVPAYQAEQFVAAALRSVQAQTLRDWECIVIDDGSTDATADVVRTFAASDERFRLIRQANRGLPGARNTGLWNLSPSAEFVSFLDADDMLCPDALRVLLCRLEESASAIGAYGYAEFMDEHGAPVSPGFHSARQRSRRKLRGWTIRRVREMEPVTFTEWLIVGPLWPPAVGLHRRSVVDTVGFFDEDLKQVEDLDFYTRMSRHGDYLPVPEQVAWYRQHGSQMTTRRAEFWDSHDTVRRKTWASPLNTSDQRRAVVRAWRIAQLRRIARCAERLLTAVVQRRWKSAGRLFVGLVVLLVQGLRGRPPVANRRHVVWAGRDV